ncbi:MAG: peptidylprolyl isomerase [Clostridia bacterium]|nr:peptidylprolyl isomerase [Clostridia bacterium]
MKTQRNHKNPPKKKKRSPTPWIVLAAIVLLVGGLIALFSVKPWLKDYYAEIEIEDYGTVTVFLDGHAAPKTVKNFVKLAESGFYDGTTFHRIIKGFMAQGGAGDGSAAKIKGEFKENGVNNPLKHERGTISMARATDFNSGNSQFFICQTTEGCAHLDGSYAAFGHVTEGMEIVDAICDNAHPTDNNGTIPASEQPVIVRVTIRGK